MGTSWNDVARRVKRCWRRLLAALLGAGILAGALTGVAAAAPPPERPTGPKPDNVVRFEQAQAAYRACVDAALAQDKDPTTCPKPDPAKYGLTPAPEPEGLKKYRDAVAAFADCIDAHPNDPKSCGAPPDPAKYGLKPAPESAKERKFRDDVEKYKDCARKHGRTDACGPKPKPEDAGLRKQRPRK